MDVAKVVDDASVSLLDMEFEEWILRSRSSLEDVLPRMLHSSGIHNASPEQVRRIASDLHTMTNSVVDDSRIWIADILRRAGFEVQPDFPDSEV